MAISNFGQSVFNWELGMIAEKLHFADAEKIVATAEMLFQKRGFENTTIKDVTTCLRIPESLFFHYFSSTDEILELLWNDVVGRQ